LTARKNKYLPQKFDPQFTLKPIAPKKIVKSNLEDFFTTTGEQKRQKNSLKILKNILNR
jgi:hypothetical protein